MVITYIFYIIWALSIIFGNIRPWGKSLHVYKWRRPSITQKYRTVPLGWKQRKLGKRRNLERLKTKIATVLQKHIRSISCYQFLVDISFYGLLTSLSSQRLH